MKVKDHLLCGVGGEYNCKKCRFLKECRKDNRLFRKINADPLALSLVLSKDNYHA